ncbi:hypothetical protein A3F66_01515 [candidate division TM6 bacterium RIFCSPHIGHO2_12_FULL_32_22]|nr:MAG: hypothetical protein A3F66_01515 [candidate division TM6 bacterium RIFCSPHIGHO2_12_FULL_32_22]
MKKIFINSAPWETRCATTKDGKLQNIYFTSTLSKHLERSFFKGIVSKVLPGIQTAFVDINQERAGFLHISEIDRDLALSRMSDTLEIEDEDEIQTKEKPRRRHSPPNISKIFHEGEKILVQVSKEPVYEKGAKLTTCFTLPGRFVVLMPNIPKIVISKKIEAREERARLKEITKKLLPAGMGAIIRTSSKDRSEKELSKDISMLVHSWNSVVTKFKKAEGAEQLHEDLPMYLQVVRDHLDGDVSEVITDNKDIQNKIYKFIKAIAPEFVNKIKYYDGPPTLFDFFDIENQIDAALQKKVYLKSGGSIIIETTESMTVIDVNTGKFTGKENLEDTVFATNLEAANEVARQLRLRNIGGLIVIDFIDMSVAANKQRLYKTFEQNLKEQDKFQSVVLQISEFGLVQMTRKRSGRTLQQQLTENCACCHGLGLIKSIRTRAYTILRKFEAELEALNKLEQITLSINPKIFDFITQVEYNTILKLEKEYHCKIILLSNQEIDETTYKVESVQT